MTIVDFGNATPVRLGREAPPWDRLCARVVRVHTGFVLDGEPSECWLWRNRSKRADKLVVNGVRWVPYRWAYTFKIGPIPEGMTLDHLCRQPACCNPWHLEPITLEENLRREHEARRAAKTLCTKGLHPWPESASNSKRPYCVPCRRARRARARSDERGT